MQHGVSMLIFIMVSEPNFVLGIKQKSLASKEDSHVHITVRSHTCLSAGSRLHSILQPPWLTVVSRSSNQASRDLTFRSVQINASPNETNHKYVIHGLSRSKPRKLVSVGIVTHPYTPKRALENSHAPPQINDF